MFNSTLKKFQQKRDSVFLKTTSINVEYLKNDLDNILSEAIEQISEDIITKANFCEVTYFLGIDKHLYRSNEIFFSSHLDDSDGKYVLDDSYGEEFDDQICINEWKDLGHITDIYRVFQAFISGLKTYDYISVVDELFKYDESIYIRFALNK